MFIILQTVMTPQSSRTEYLSVAHPSCPVIILGDFIVCDLEYLAYHSEVPVMERQTEQFAVVNTFSSNLNPIDLVIALLLSDLPSRTFLLTT